MYLGIEADRSRCVELLDKSLIGAASLVPMIGYDLSSKVAKLALGRRTGLGPILLELGILNQEQIDAVLSPSTLKNPLSKRAT